MPQLCLHFVNVFLALEVTYKAEEKKKFVRRVKTWGHKFITVPRILSVTFRPH